MGDAHVFLSALFGQKPSGSGLQLWHKDTKKAHTFVNIQAAVDHVEIAQDHDVYVSAGLTGKAAKPSKTRLTNTTVAAIPGVWADIDVNGGPEAKTNAAPTLEAARELAEAVLKPTLIVNSGYGLQPWWLFEGGPWVFSTVAERDQAQRLVVAFQAALKAKARTISESFGLDSTHDIARLMRVPGTRNHKGADNGKEPAPVTLVANDGGLYTIETISSIGQDHLAEAAQRTATASTGDAVTVELRGRSAQPSWRVGQLAAVDVDFRVVWERKKLGKAREWTGSEFDLSIATRLVEAGCDDQEIADAVVYSRIEHSDDAQGKSGRLDYIKRTISKARQRSDTANRTREAEALRTEAAEQLEAIAADKDAPNEPARTVNLFTQLLGGPEVKELIQDSRDPEQVRYRLILADGGEVPLGDANDLFSPDRFRGKFAVVTQHVVPTVKRDKWFNIIQALLLAATVNEGHDETRESRARAVIADYVDRGLSNDKNAAMQAHDPFEHDGLVHVPSMPFGQWLRRVRGEKIAEADVREMLRVAGFERRILNFRRDDGRKSSRSYWIGDIDGGT